MSTRMKTKKSKMLKSFKNMFCNKNRQTQSDLNAWKRFCLQQDENRELCEIPADELNLLLCKFFKTVKKLDGTEYKPVRLTKSSAFLERKRFRYECY